MCCRFCFCCGHKLATCGHWLINNEYSFYMHVIRYLDSFSLDVLELALELLPLAWVYGLTYFLLCYYGPAYYLLCYHGPAYYFVMLFYCPTYYLLCYYGPTYYFAMLLLACILLAVLLWACMLLCWMLLSNQIFDVN